MVHVGYEFAEFNISEFHNNLTANIMYVLMAAVMPSPQLANDLQILRDGAPSLLSGLQTVAVQQVLRGLEEEPPPDCAAVLGALESGFRQRR